MKTITNKDVKKTITRHRKRKNISGNFRGSEDIFFIKIVKGFKKFLEPPKWS